MEIKSEEDLILLLGTTLSSELFSALMGRVGDMPSADRSGRSLKQVALAGRSGRSFWQVALAGRSS